MNPKTKLLHSIYSLPGFGGTSLRKIAGAFRSAEEILSASPEQLHAIGISPRSADIFLSNKKNINISADWDILQKNNICVFAPDDPEYPPLLKEIPDAPALLYVRGNIQALHLPCVALVGTRKPTDYGRHIARTLSRDLARSGVCIVSGLALGLDAEAHLGTLEGRDTTIASLGNGLLDKHIAPRTNFSLAQSILAKGGALISELLPDTPATVGTFPARNRLIAGMSHATVVIEAGEKSGTLITARLALDYNRDVFAVPGSILSPLSQGANKLLKDGARVVTCANDILETLAFATATKPQSQIQETTSLPPEDRTILNALSTGPMHLPDIARATNLSPATLGTCLTMLELAGYIRDIGGGKYIRV